jgi:hypothetical protein
LAFNLKALKVSQVMTGAQASRALRPAVALWAFAGLIGIPSAVYFDLLWGGVALAALQTRSMTG